MNQSIKSYKKNEFKDSSIKIAFQANIFKYIERKKREVSVFTALNKKYAATDDRIHSTSSNLINKITESEQPKPNQLANGFSILSNTKIKNLQANLQQSNFIARKKKKGHKSSLSDWRNLYEQRDQITQKHTTKNISPNKMIVTDRLFYPRKKEQNCHKYKGQTQTIKQISEEQPKKNKFLNTISNFNSSSREKYFVNDQNFIHMYHRSYSPILSDYAEKKRMMNYLRDNKQRKKSNSGLRLMNEGIFNQTGGSDVSFVPYKNQFINSELKTYINSQLDIQQALGQNLNLPKQSALQRKTIKISEVQKRKFVRQTAYIKGQFDEENPESPIPLNSKIGELKNFSNLSQMCSGTLGQVGFHEQHGNVKLRMFKARRNKIQSGIFSIKKTVDEESRFANFQYSLGKTKLRSTYANWANLRRQA